MIYFDENFLYENLSMKITVEKIYHKKNIKVILKNFTYKRCFVCKNYIICLNKNNMIF